MRMIIFGCGYVGRGLATAAVEAGHEVWIHSRNRDSLEAVGSVPANQKIVGQLHEATWHGHLAGPFDVAYNLVSSAGGGLDGYQLSYIEGNQSIRDWAADDRVGRFIYTSATSVYPQSDGSWVDEESVPSDSELSPSGRVLRQAEEEILSSEVYPEALIARLAGIYGPGRHLYLNSLREGANELPGDGAAWLNLIHLRDIVGVLLGLASAPYDQDRSIVNVVDDEPVQKQRLVDWLAEQLGCPTIPFNPASKGSRASRRTTSRGLPNRRVRNDRLKALLDWQPQFPTYREGYRNILSTT